MNINKKYAIRKLAVGVASVTIGLFISNAINIDSPFNIAFHNIVKAEEITNWQPQGNIVAQGVEGVAWELYENGYLLFKPYNGNTTMTRNPIESSWAKYAEQIKAISFSETIQAPVNSEGLFSGLNNVEYIETEKLDVSNVVNMNAMFYNNSLKNESKIKKLNVSNWNVSNVVNMNRTFMGLNNLKSLDVDNWHTSKVKDMYAVFQGLHELNELKMSHFDTTSITSEYNSSNMFVGLRKLLKIKLGDKLANGTLYNKVFLSLVPSRISVGDIFLPDVYTERWVKEDGTVGPYTYEELYSEYKKNPQKMNGTWVREKKITSYTVNFATNSSETINNISVEKDTPATLPTPTVDNTGYKFLGWAKSQDGEVITNTTNIASPGETITLYAKWEKVNNITKQRTPIDPTTIYQGDNTLDKGQRNEEVGKAGEKEFVTTYKVTPITGELTEPTTTENIITPMKPKVVKVGTKPTIETEKIPSPVKYEKDTTREKGQDNITVQGKDGSKTTTTTYTVDETTGEITQHPQEPIIVEPTNTIVKVALKDKVVYSKDGDNIIKETTTYNVHETTGDITENTTRETFKENGAKDKVVIETLPSPIRYEKDTTREKGQDNITIQGKEGSKTTTTTYTIDENTGDATPHLQEPVIVKPTNTIIKVALKDKVVYSKDGDNIIKETTSYTINETTGDIKENTIREIFKENGAKDKVVIEILPSPVKYGKDDTREKGQDNITIQGKDGSKTTTVTYTVDENTGDAIPHLQEPVIIKPTDTIIKVALKDKVTYLKDGDNIIKETTSYTINETTGVVTENITRETFKENGTKDKVVVETLPSPVKYGKDDTREKGQDNITIQGKDGSKTTTITYTLNPDTGEAVGHPQKPVIVEPTTTLIKVAAKDKVNLITKDDGSVIKETISYIVNEKTGEITETKTEEVVKNKIDISKGEDTPVVDNLPELKVAVIKDRENNILDVIKENEIPKNIKGYKNTGKTETDKNGYKVYIYEKLEENSKGNELPPVIDKKDFVGGVNSNEPPIVETLPDLKVAVIKDRENNILDVIKADEKPKDILGYVNSGQTEIDKDGYKVYIYEKVEDKQDSIVDRNKETTQSKTEEKDELSTNENVNNKDTINKKEKLPKTSTSFFSSLGLLAGFGLLRRKEDK